MDVAKYGRAEVVLPHLEDDLHDVGHLDGHEPERHFQYADKAVRQLSITDRTLANGRIFAIEAQRAAINRVNFTSIYIERCLFTSSEWAECTLSRVVFRDCKILDATFSDSKWKNVVFDGCKIEYSTLASIRASAPVVFVNTTFNEVTFEECDFPGGHMSGCELAATEFVGGEYREFDLRHNDLSTIRGAVNLAGAAISRDQRQELGEALVSELDLHYLDDGDP
jgi:uncharacterized protein YjbI with pentapeptide repeats